MIKTCPRCFGAMEPKILDPLTAAADPLSLRVSGMPAAMCPKGHAAPVDGDFMLWFVRELKARAGELPGGEEKGMLFKKYFCACGRELAAKPEKSRAFSFDLAYEGAAPFKAEVQMPVYKCSGCGKEQLRSPRQVQKHAGQAIVALNDALGFQHSG